MDTHLHARGDDAQIGDWSVLARGVLRGAGYSRGAARDALIDVFAAERCALSVPEVEAQLAARRPVGRASVYRALDVLGQLGLIVRVDVGDGLPRYERAEPGTDQDSHQHHHHHMLCDRCGTLIAFDDGDLEDAIENLVHRFGFDARAHEVTLRGTCRACRV